MMDFGMALALTLFFCILAVGFGLTIAVWFWNFMLEEK